MPEPDDALPELGSRRERRPRRSVGLDQVFDTIQPTQAEPERTKTLTNSLGMVFVLVPAGSFQMGSSLEEDGHRTNEGPVHEVVVGSTFYLSVHLITQRVFQIVCGRNPSKFHAANGGSPEHPVEMVSWDDAVGFCRHLTNQPEERDAGRSYRLPTEAEWEYACRAGKTDAPFSHGATFNADHGNFDTTHTYGDIATSSLLGSTSPVNRYPANAWGLHDMHGNIWEWCSDWYAEGYYRASPTRDPKGPETGKARVLRGGSWRNQGASCRAAYRNALAPYQRDSATGFRVVIVLGERPA